jgi:hypothetical protein
MEADEENWRDTWLSLALAVLTRVIVREAADRVGRAGREGARRAAAVVVWGRARREEVVVRRSRDVLMAARWCGEQAKPEAGTV